MGWNVLQQGFFNNNKRLPNRGRLLFCCLLHCMCSNKNVSEVWTATRNACMNEDFVWFSLVSFFALSQKEETGNNSTALRKCIGYVCFCDGRYYLHNAPKAPKQERTKKLRTRPKRAGGARFSSERILRRPVAHYRSVSAVQLWKQNVPRLWNTPACSWGYVSYTFNRPITYFYFFFCF